MSLTSWLGGLVTSAQTWIGTEISRALAPIIASIHNVSLTVTSWAEDLFGNLHTFIHGFIFLLEQIVELAGLVVKAILLLAQLLVSATTGMLSTFHGLVSITPTAPTMAPGIDTGIAWVVAALNPYGLQLLGYGMAAALWVATGMAVIRMISQL